MTPAQLRVWKEIQEINRGWFLLRALVAIVSVLAVALIVFLSLNKGTSAAAISAALDGVFGVCLLKITDYHYPNAIKVETMATYIKEKSGKLFAGQD